MKASLRYDKLHDKLKEECGIVSLHNVDEAADLSIKALMSLQHRGQQACGIFFKGNNDSRIHKNLGLVSEVFKSSWEFSNSCKTSIGHVRYATSGANVVTEAQPFAVLVNNKNLVLAHNGHILDGEKLKSALKSNGQCFETNSDSEILLLYLKNILENQKSLEYAIKLLLHNISGAYSVVGIYGDVTFAFRDEKGFRPLVMGRKVNKEGSVGYTFASETCAIEMMEAAYVREIRPGELCLVDNSQLTSHQIITSSKTSMCSFEYVYFSRSDSVIFHKSVYETRLKLGEQLALEETLDKDKIDVVIGVPDSGTAAAIGYAEKLNKPFHLGLVKNSYVGRSFIAGNQAMRESMVKLKLNPLQKSIEGKSIIVVDDSLVRGTTSRQIVEALKKRGAREVHLRVASPPIKYSCFFGVDTPETKDLVANNMTTLQMNQLVGSHSLSFLSWKGYLNVLPEKNKYCMACFNGEYPLAISENSFHNSVYANEKSSIRI
jgi:amidophosphoribosyltransferase